MALLYDRDVKTIGKHVTNAFKEELAGTQDSVVAKFATTAADGKTLPAKTSVPLTPEGYGKEVLGLFFDELTREQRRAIEVATADGAKWIKKPVKRRRPNARWVMDPFHVVQWMNGALDGVRREEWRKAKWRPPEKGL